MDGDTVVVQLLPYQPSEGNSAGYVVRVVAAKEHKMVVGHLKLCKLKRPTKQVCSAPLKASRPAV